MFNIFKKKNAAFIVYQMGKVGSSTIKDSLIRKYGKKKVFHTHNHEKAKIQIEQWRRCFDAVIVITGFREPLNRCLSAYFENFTNDRNHWYVGRQKEVIKKSIDWLISDYNAKVVPHIHQVVSPWLKNYESAINCKLSDFVRTGSYRKVCLGNVYFSIYTLERLTQFYQAMAVDPLFGNVRIVNSNIGENKWYSSIYSDFKNKYQITIDEYDNLYGSIDYVPFLYNEHEIKNHTKRLVLV